MRAVRALLACAVAAAAFPAAAKALTLTYTVETRGDVEADVDEFRSLAHSILTDDRGWALEGAIGFRRVDSGGGFRLILASPSEVAAAHPVCSADWSCRVGDQVLINDRNWRLTTDAWTGTLRGYRTYLVNHEVGHWLGFGHHTCPEEGALAPVMQQQSITLDGCRPNPWPLEWERERVAQMWDVSFEEGRPWPVSPGLVLGVGALVPRARRVRRRALAQPGDEAGSGSGADPRLGLAAVARAHGERRRGGVAHRQQAPLTA